MREEGVSKFTVYVDEGCGGGVKYTTWAHTRRQAEQISKKAYRIAYGFTSQKFLRAEAKPTAVSEDDELQSKCCVIYKGDHLRVS
jgi:hypothetical protein